jgi:hypothetical protein
MSEMAMFRQLNSPTRPLAVYASTWQARASAIIASRLEMSYFDTATERNPMVYVKAILSGMAAVIATELLTIWWVLRPWSSQKATGLELIFAVLRASLVHAQPWILAIFLFATFFAASRLDSKTLRVVLFWIPTVTISCIGITLVALVANVA